MLVYKQENGDADCSATEIDKLTETEIHATLKIAAMECPVLDSAVAHMELMPQCEQMVVNKRKTKHKWSDT